MRILTAEAYTRAAHFVADEARPLEVARFAVHFEDGDLDAVDDELSEFQNEDGGFGNALEPDLRCPDSSAAATITALRILAETGAPPSSDLVEDAVDYLVDTFEPDLCGWHSTPPAVHDHPHAEWWGRPLEPGEWPLFNIEIIAHLYDYADLVPRELLDAVTDRALRHLREGPDTLEMHAFASYQHLAARIDVERAKTLIGKLTGVAQTIVVTDSSKWGQYVPTPLWIAPSPSSPFASLVSFEIDANLDELIARQHPDGSWRPRWRWGGYPDVWPQAEREWAGIVSLEALLQLRDYGRIQGF